MAWFDSRNVGQRIFDGHQQESRYERTRSQRGENGLKTRPAHAWDLAKEATRRTEVLP